MAGVLFAEDFDLLDAPRPADASPASFDTDPIEVELDAARQVAIAQARSEGHAAAEASAKSAASRALAAIAAELSGAERRAAADAESASQALARLLVAQLAAMLPATCDRYGAGEVRRIATAIFPALRREPAVTVRVNPETHASVEEFIATLDEASASRVRLVATAELRADEITVEWRDGRAGRDRRAVWDQVCAALGLADLLDGDGDTSGDSHAG